MPTWDEVAEKQRDTLQGAGVVASDAGAISALPSALLAGKAGRVQLALLDRSNLASDDWRKVCLLGRLPAMGKAPEDWSIIDEHGDVLDEPPDTPGGLLLHEHGNHALVEELVMGYYRIAGRGGACSGPFTRHTARPAFPARRAPSLTLPPSPPVHSCQPTRPRPRLLCLLRGRGWL